MLLPSPTRLTTAAVLLLALVGCTVTRVESPDPSAIPTDEPVAQGDEPTGPIVELASDRVSGVGWRYFIYETADGQCTQFETVQFATAACGQLLPEEGRVFGSVGDLGDESGLHPIEGVVTTEVATVWLVQEDQSRNPALLIPLDEAGLDGQAFIGFVPSGATITHLLAVKFNGEILETYELP